MESVKIKTKQPIQPRTQPIQSSQPIQPRTPHTQQLQSTQPTQPTQQIKPKLSQKNKKKPIPKPNCQSKQKIKTNNNVNGKVIFNLKNNYTEKFYCPQLAISKLTKSQNINLESIPDLPEIPLDTLFGSQ